MSLFGMTTFMFAMGIITLALYITTSIQDVNLDAADSYIFETTSLLMVRLCDPFLSSA
jgi:hypothetical protein